MSTRLWLAAALAACGEAHHTQDAGPPDVSTDTLAPLTGTPPANAVTLSVTLDHVPVSGAPVYFQDTTTTVAGVTDASGFAWAVIATGGTVTVIQPPAGNGLVELATFAAVAQGDALHLDLVPHPSGAYSFLDFSLASSITA